MILSIRSVLLCAAGLTMLAAAPAPSAANRAAALTARMTHAEKLAFVHGYFPPMAKGAPADVIPSAGYVPGIARLGIPALRETDASLGVANQMEQRLGDVATALPSGLALAAGFDPVMARAGGAMIGAEARAKTFNVMLSGGVNLTRDPWGGRNFEYLGEDPWLAGTLAGAAIAGVQSNHIVSTIKHFALNPQETGRQTVDARIGEAALRESDLLAFQIAIERGRPGSVMCSYNRVQGDYACENPFLLTDVLRRDWGYDGWVMSDWGAVHSTVKAAINGLDQQSGQELDRGPYFGKPLADAVAAGTVPPARLDQMVRRILTGVAGTGLLDHPTPARPQSIDYAANARIAQAVAEAGIVLLKNDGILPLTAASTRRILVIGAHADVGVLSGGGSSQVRSVGGAPVEMRYRDGGAASFARRTWHASSPLDAVRAAAPGALTRFIGGGDVDAAVAAAKDADVVLLFAWQWTTEAEDAASLTLPDSQDALIAAVARANRKTVIVLETGGPVTMPWLDRVPAVVEAWYPGQRGGEAIARVLFGMVNPSGRLPITFPRKAADAPRPVPPGWAAQQAYDLASANGDKKADIAPFAAEYVEGAAVGYRWYDQRGRAPLFAFGHGLSYTRFAYSDLAVDATERRVSFTVTNTGARSGADTPQLYVRAGRRDGATLRLAGYERVMLAPGEAHRVTLTIDPRIIADFDPAQRGWHLAAGDYPLSIGRFAGDRTLTGTMKLGELRLRP